MSSYKKITRASLYESESDADSASDEGGYMPNNFDFEFIEVDESKEKENDESNQATSEIGQEQGEDHSDEEFDFPLFAAPSTTPNVAKEGTQSVSDEERGRSNSRVMKVSLREESEENIKNERPLSYYRAVYSHEDKQQFLQTAVSGDDIYAQLQVSCPLSDPKPWKCMDLAAHNAKIDREAEKQKKRSHSRRAGKKKRESKVGCRERKLERRRIEKKLQKEKDAKRKKQLYGKQSAFKPKSKRFNLKAGSSAAKPKFRTE